MCHGVHATSFGLLVEMAKFDRPPKLIWAKFDRPPKPILAIFDRPKCSPGQWVQCRYRSLLSPRLHTHRHTQTHTHKHTHTHTQHSYGKQSTRCQTYPMLWCCCGGTETQSEARCMDLVHHVTVTLPRPLTSSFPIGTCLTLNCLSMGAQALSSTTTLRGPWGVLPWVFVSVTSPRALPRG